MTEKLAIIRDKMLGESIVLYDAGKSIAPQFLMIPKFAREFGNELQRTSKSGH